MAYPLWLSRNWMNLKKVTQALGLDSLGGRINQLSEAEITELLGPAVTNQDMQNIQMEEIRDLIKAVSSAIDTSDPKLDVVLPVPVDKLEFNELPNHWRLLISGGRKNAHIIRLYFDQHYNALIGEKVARHFSDRYRDLKSQNLKPSDIMNELNEFVADSGTVTAGRQVAVQALLAYLFDCCDIFENRSKGDKS